MDVLEKEKAKKRMPKLNHIQYAKAESILIEKEYSLSALIENTSFDELTQEYKKNFTLLN